MAGRPALLVAFIVMLMLIRAVPVYVALSLDKRKNPLSSHHRVTVALYCTTALPIDELRGVFQIVPLAQDRRTVPLPS